MTRKKALLKTIKIIKRLEMDDGEKDEILSALQLCLSELPFSKWSKETIFDACDQFVEEHGSLIINDLYKGQLPSHSVIKLKFGMSAKEFRDKYYPLPDHSDKIREETKKVFVEEYNKVKPIGREDYDQRRDKSTPCSITIMKRLNVNTWGDLVKTFDLPVHYKKRQVKNFVVSTTHAIDRID